MSNESEAGKGDRQRARQVSYEEYANNWEIIFGGHQISDEAYSEAVFGNDEMSDEEFEDLIPMSG